LRFPAATKHHNSYTTTIAPPPTSHHSSQVVLSSPLALPDLSPPTHQQCWPLAKINHGDETSRNQLPSKPSQTDPNHRQHHPPMNNAEGHHPVSYDLQQFVCAAKHQTNQISCMVAVVLLRIWIYHNPLKISANTTILHMSYNRYDSLYFQLTSHYIWIYLKRIYSFCIASPPWRSNQSLEWSRGASVQTSYRNQVYKEEGWCKFVSNLFLCSCAQFHTSFANLLAFRYDAFANSLAFRYNTCLVKV
jgi:hypothetical protein